MIGTGYVGLVSGVCFSDLGNDVVCVDKDINKIDLLKNGKIPIYEPGLSELVVKNYKNKRLTFSSDLKTSVKNSDIILYGESLGTGVAVELGQNKKFNSIILESPYTSIEKAAKIYYPYLPIKFFLKDKYNSLKKIQNVKIPILIMHGKDDTIIPFEMGYELFQKANEPKFSFFPENDNHMMSFNDDLMKNIKSFIFYD